MQKRTSKILIGLLALLFTFMIGIGTTFIKSSGFSANADKTGMAGYDLGEYSVKINYCYFVEYISGIYFAYEVIFDREFYYGLEDKSAVLNAVKDTFVKNNYNVDIDNINGKMTAYLEFDSVTDYYVAAGVDGYEKNEKKEPVKSTLFYQDYASESYTVFADIKKEGKFINKIYTACSSFGISDDKILMNYIYGTPYDNKMITSTADSVTYSSANKLYYHTFVITMSNIERKVSIYQHIPNSKGWYLIAILIGVAVLSAPLTVLIVKRKKEKNNG